MRPLARFRGKGEVRLPPPPPDPGQLAANAAAAHAVAALLPQGKANAADVIAQTAIGAYILERSKQAFTDPEIMAALSSQRPWDMVRLVAPERQVEAVLTGMLPLLGQLAGQIDPTGQKPFFAWSKEEVMRLIEAACWAWEEAQGTVKAPDVLTARPAAPRASELVMAGITHAATPYRGAVIDDEIPF
jgi:hypothetical protein